MKIISEKNENQLFSIPLICLHSLSNDFQKSNFIFSEDQSEKSENQKYFKLILKIHRFLYMYVKTIFENYLINYFKLIFKPLKKILKYLILTNCE